MPWEIDTGLQILTISRMDTTSPISGGLRLKGLLIPREAVLMLLNRILRVAIALLLLLAKAKVNLGLSCYSGQVSV